MKSILAALVLTFSLNILAQDAVILETSHRHDFEYSLSFGANTEMGRAWVVITKADVTTYEEADETDYRVKVEGLAFDAATNTIVYTDIDGTETVCATYSKRRGIFGGVRINKTNKCKLTGENFVTEYDNGFEMKKALKRRFFLSI